MKSELWKTSLAVWLPVIVLASIYGIAYLVRYEQAKNLQNRWNNYMSICQAKVTEENAKSTTHGVQICYAADVKINHGLLGLPQFTENGIATSIIPKP